MNVKFIEINGYNKDILYKELIEKLKGDVWSVWDKSNTRHSIIEYNGDIYYSIRRDNNIETSFSYLAKIVYEIEED